MLAHINGLYELDHLMAAGLLGALAAWLLHRRYA